MTPPHRHGLFIALSVLAAAWSFSPIRGEVSVERDATGQQTGLLTTFHMRGGDDLGPVPWRVERSDIPLEWSLNPEGDANGDGRPDFAIDPVTRRPYVAWSWWDGTDYEIMISHWDGTRWTTPERLTDNTTNDLGPALFYTEDGSRQLSWWRSNPKIDETPKVWYREKAELNDFWSSEEPVSETAQRALHPSVAAPGPDESFVAYQVDEGGTRQHVFVARKLAGNTEFTERRALGIGELLRSASSEAPDIELRLYAEQNKLWVNWIRNDHALAYSVYDPSTGEWSPPKLADYATHIDRIGWPRMAREFARQDIRRRVLQEP